MSDRSVKFLILGSAFILILSASILYVVFDRQGYSKNKVNAYVNYNINDYIEVNAVSLPDYSNIYRSINVSKITFKNLDTSLTSSFMTKEEELISYITSYYNETISTKNSEGQSDYEPLGVVSSKYKTLINGAVLSIFYELDFTLDQNVYENNIKSYIITLNIDLGTNKILTNDDLLSKYNYTRESISEKLYEDSIVIPKGQIVIDKNTNISLTRSDIERKRKDYVERIVSEFDNIINMYIESNSLVLVYDEKRLSETFFTGNFMTNISTKYLK